ncbi:MAG: rhodanese-like domain-containing protein [Anaerolineaceae bacterium]|nr:rhodanese-like domain-containing protein [Anaerolineaceae bacterium]MDD4043228.1 rhodanese-like domain-containing protein [Anaerolineaceae bacterium]MDD4577528.1 rhodanese-like domain-containing protein [Anaerolineaceae bacterium]
MVTSKKKSQSSKQKGALPGWVWILVVIVVAFGGYLAIRLTNQRQKAVSTLPAEMTVAEVALLDPAEWFFLDVREQSEWNESHIGWATLIPLGQLEDRQDELPKDQKIVVICRSGNRSAQGRDILLKAGFIEVTSMAGGMNDWIKQGLPVVTGP